MMTLHMGSFIRAMNEIKKDTSVELRKLMAWQMALVLQNVMVNVGVKLDAELGLGGGSSKLPAQRDRQKDTVASQINKIFQAPDSSWSLTAPDNRGNVVSKKGKAIFYIDSEHRVDDLDKMAKIHKKFRGKRGQVEGQFVNEKRGNVTFTGKYITTQDNIASYIKFVQTHIGRTKASFLESLEYFSNRSGGYAAWTPPEWITRHGNYYGGANLEQFDPQTMTGTWSGGSDIPWAAELNANGKVTHALEMRKRDIESGRVLKKLTGLIEKHNKVAA